MPKRDNLPHPPSSDPPPTGQLQQMVLPGMWPEKSPKAPKAARKNASHPAVDPHPPS